MSLPAMTAEASLYRSSVAYGTKPARGPAPLRNNVSLAQDTCTCTSPSCTWSCPAPPPPPGVCPGKCMNLPFCGRLKCCCEAEGGDWVYVGPFPGVPCQHVCT